jgi:hypothetical protein
MDELHSILQGHKSRHPQNYHQGPGPKSSLPPDHATESVIPDLFFDRILVEYKLTRTEVLVLMYLYRSVWCRPNLHKVHGISGLLSHTEMGKNLGLTIDEIYHSLRKLEEYQFISTIRMGQYFVRRYFTKEFDEYYQQSYDDFDSL